MESCPKAFFAVAFAAPQSTASIVFGVVDADDSLTGADELGAQGQIAGTGPDGTTYVVSIAEVRDGLVFHQTIVDLFLSRNTDLHRCVV